MKDNKGRGIGPRRGFLKHIDPDGLHIAYEIEMGGPVEKVVEWRVETKGIQTPMNRGWIGIQMRNSTKSLDQHTKWINYEDL